MQERSSWGYNDTRWTQRFFWYEVTTYGTLGKIISKKILFWGSWARRPQYGLEMRFFNFYGKLKHKFLIQWENPEGVFFCSLLSYTLILLASEDPPTIL